MNVLVVGSGAREHALIWKLNQSPLRPKIWCAPGNPGIAALASIAPIKVDDISGLKEFAKREVIDLTIVGPELPLTLGITDAFAEANLLVLGPTQAAAQLEGSKQFAKSIMNAAGVPTAAHRVFTHQRDLEEFARGCHLPVVFKADGLAAGKGVVVCTERNQAMNAVSYLWGELGATSIVTEDFLAGTEASLIVLTDGTTIVPMATSHDFKRVGDNDTGPNTGGMGSISPTPRIPAAQMNAFVERCIRPILVEMEKRGHRFAGFLYAGLMIDNGGQPKVLEYNCRLGDPECQVIMRRMEGDFLPLLEATARGKLAEYADKISWKPESAACVVMASDGYPANPKPGDEILGIELASQLRDVVVFHAGTSLENRKLLTAGGRVLSVTALGETPKEAASAAYRGVDMIQYRGRVLRRDIA
jgi:phosphoribosylamine--glycine ligase